MLHYKCDTDVVMAMSDDSLYNLRLPLLVYVGYKLFHRHIFSQLLQIFLFGVVAHLLTIIISALINQHLVSICFHQEISYFQSVMLFSAIIYMDPMTIINMRQNKDFYLFLGVMLISNAVSNNLVCESSALASMDYNLVNYQTYLLITLQDVSDIVLGCLLGFIIAIFTSMMSRLTGKEKDCTHLEPIIVAGGTMLTYFLSNYLTFSSVLVTSGV